MEFLEVVNRQRADSIDGNKGFTSTGLVSPRPDQYRCHGKQLQKVAFLLAKVDDIKHGGAV